MSTQHLVLALTPWSGPLTLSPLDAPTLPPLPAAACSRLAGLMLPDMPPAVVEASNIWTEAESHACRQASWSERNFPVVYCGGPLVGGVQRSRRFGPITRRSCG